VDGETLAMATKTSCTSSADTLTKELCDALIDSSRRSEVTAKSHPTDASVPSLESTPHCNTYDIHLLLFPGPYPSGVDVARREAHLDDPAFLGALGVTRAQFGDLPLWRQVRLCCVLHLL
jgi:hypothetical protein